jgi:hypothetical protein
MEYPDDDSRYNSDYDPLFGPPDPELDRFLRDLHGIHSDDSDFGEEEMDELRRQYAEEQQQEMEYERKLAERMSPSLLVLQETNTGQPHFTMMEKASVLFLSSNHYLLHSSPMKGDEPIASSPPRSLLRLPTSMKSHLCKTSSIKFSNLFKSKCSSLTTFRSDASCRQL